MSLYIARDIQQSKRRREMRGVILSDGAGYDSIEQEWVMSTGQQWAMVLWTAAVIFGAVKIYKMITKQ